MIKENQIPEELSTDPEVLKDMFVRFVTAKGTGLSKNKKLSELILKIANIYGLQAALDSKITKNVSGGAGIIPTYLDDGDIDFSTFKIGTFDSAATIDSLTDNGFYTAEGTGSGYKNSIMGNVYAVFVFNNTQTVYSSDRGIWYRIYSGGWSIPSYVGGSVNNITVSRAQADWLVANNSLTAGAVYRIFDHPDYMYIVLTAATSSTFFEDGLAYAVRPKYRDVATYTIGGETVDFVGCWSFLTSASVGDVAWYCNRLYVNQTDSVGTASGFALDLPDWLLINFRLNPEFYAFEWHGIVYDYANDYVKLESDAFGNEFGDIIKRTPDDGFRCHMNDWSVGGFKNNKCNRWYNNNYGSCENNIGGADVHSNYGGGLNGNRFNGSVCIIARNTFLSMFNNVLNYEAIITDNGNISANVIISGSSIGGEIMENAAVETTGGDNFGLIIQDCRVGKSGDIKRCYGQIRECVVDGNIFDNNTDNSGSMDISYSNIHAGSTIENCGTVFIRDSIIQSRVTVSGADVDISDSDVKGNIVTTGDILLARSEFRGNVPSGTGDYQYSDSFLLNAPTTTATRTIRQSSGTIFASLYIGSGEFFYTRDGKFKAPVQWDGCAVNVVASNGVTITGTNISNLAITIVHSGNYKVKYESSAKSPDKLDVESKVYKGATAIPMLYNKKTYTGINEWINSSISGIVPLVAGDVITVKYASPPSGTTASFLLGQINITIEYKGQ